MSAGLLDCWALFRDCVGVRSQMYKLFKLGMLFFMQEFAANLKHRMRGVWRDAELLDPNMHNNKLATYHSWFAIPFSRNERMPIIVRGEWGFQRTIEWLRWVGHRTDFMPICYAYKFQDWLPNMTISRTHKVFFLAEACCNRIQVSCDTSKM